MNQSIVHTIGLAHFWAQGDAVTHGVAILLLVMSGASWTIMLGKLTAHLRYSRSIDRALAAFWDSESRNLALAALRAGDVARDTDELLERLHAQAAEPLEQRVQHVHQ